ncbi:hypothetical protein ABEB36_015497 [Hypothenemus hampei]|uniref:PHD-type domain-containing protein n=1 Tax=Hypothenemus hampei TaxID=57062 RepID=A0ABD1E1L4_HYPHA
MPTVIKKRGRPSGADKTVIGLKRKKIKKRPVEFVKKSVNDQICDILKWVIANKDIIECAINGDYLLGTKNITEDLNQALFDDRVDLELVKKFFDFNKRKHKEILKCNSCDSNLNRLAIKCDSCLSWFNLDCVGLQTKPKKRLWFCRNCFV